MKAGIAVAATVATFVVVSPASAGIVTQLGSTAGYFAFPGEKNDVVVAMEGDVAVIADKGTGIFVVGLGCIRSGAQEARCRAPKTLHVQLDDGDDSLVARIPLNVVADGGTGNDHLVTGSGTDTLLGGDGKDTLTGGGGADILDGGLGDDIVSYATRTKRVIVTLDGDPNDGEAGEGDQVVAAEAIVGGDGPDILVGDAGPNQLFGGPGDDALAGGGGADTLVGGAGKDGINADDGPGAAGADNVGCGDGRDRVFGDPNDAINADCEAIDRSGVLAARAVGDAGPDPPVLGKSVVVTPVSGVVLVVPSDPSNPTAPQPVPAAPPVPLNNATNIPVGSVVDTRLGTVELTTAIDDQGTTQTGQFRSGPFQVFQRAVNGATADLALRGGKSFAVCGQGQSGPGMNAFSSAKRRRVIRRLWSDAHGQFRTAGRFASATVRGTKWLTEDLCEGTLVKVARGEVLVHDAVANRDVVVDAGRQYLARTP